MEKEHIDRHELFVREFARYEQNLRRYVYALLGNKSDTEDVMQDTSVALWRKFAQYDTDKPFINWACRFAYYEVMAHRKKQARQHQFFSEAVMEALAREQISNQDHLEAQQVALEGCVAKLSADDRRILEFRYTSGSTIAELSEKTGQSAKKLYHALDRIRRQLNLCVNKHMQVEGWSS